MPPLEQAVFNDSFSSFDPSAQLKELAIETNHEADGHRPAKRVSFSKSIRCRLIKTHTEISKNRKRQVWYSSKEEKQFRRDAIETVRKMTENIPLGEDETARGLETKPPHELKALRSEVRQIVALIVAEQSRVFTPARQQDSSSEDSDEEKLNDAEVSFPTDEYLAALYHHVTRRHTAKAIRLAETDAREVYGERN